MYAQQSKYCFVVTIKYVITLGRIVFSKSTTISPALDTIGNMYI